MWGVGMIINTAGIICTRPSLSHVQLALTFSKTSIYFYYPTTYFKVCIVLVLPAPSRFRHFKTLVQTVNYQPWEQVGYGTGSGSSYTAFSFIPPAVNLYVPATTTHQRQLWIKFSDRPHQM